MSHAIISILTRNIINISIFTRGTLDPSGFKKFLTRTPECG